MRSVLHVDINNFYASAECKNRPELAGQPVAVGGLEQARHGIILAKNELAKSVGVKTGEPLWMARQKCPNLVILPPNYPLYQKYSKLAFEIYCRYTNQVESFGLDEAWLDVTGSKIFGSAEEIAKEISNTVKEELGITVSIGVSFNKVFAKLGSDMKKPDAITIISKENFREKIWELPIQELLYIGKATTKKLNKCGIIKIGTLAQTPKETLQGLLGKWGLILHDYANGLDCSKVQLVDQQNTIKSIGNSTTTPRDLLNEQDVSSVFYMLSESVAKRLRSHNMRCGTVSIWLRDNTLNSFERQVKLDNPTYISIDIYTAAMQLLQAEYDWKKPLRSVGIRGCDLTQVADFVQLSMFDAQTNQCKRELLENAIDSINQRFGDTAVSRAVTIADQSLGSLNDRQERGLSFSMMSNII